MGQPPVRAEHLNHSFRVFFVVVYFEYYEEVHPFHGKYMDVIPDAQGSTRGYGMTVATKGYSIIVLNLPQKVVI